MTKIAKPLPRLTETATGGYVELDDGVRIAWSRAGAKWSVRIESDGGIDVLGVSREEKAVSVH